MKWPCIASHRYGFHDISQKNIHRNDKSAKINSPKRNIPENPIHRKRKFLENYNYPQISILRKKPLPEN